MRYTPISEANIKAKVKLLKSSLAKSGRDVPLTVCQNHLSRGLGYSGWAELMKNIPAELTTTKALPDFVACAGKISRAFHIPTALGNALLLRIGLFPSAEYTPRSERVWMAMCLNIILVAEQQPIDFTITTNQKFLDHLVAIDLVFERFSELLRQPEGGEMLAIETFLDAVVKHKHIRSTTGKFPIEVIFDMQQWVHQTCNLMLRRSSSFNTLSLEEDQRAEELANDLPETGLVLVTGPAGAGNTTATHRILHQLGKSRRVSTSSGLIFNAGLYDLTSKPMVYNIGGLANTLQYMEPKRLFHLARNHLVFAGTHGMNSENSMQTAAMFLENKDVKQASERLKEVYAGAIFVDWTNRPSGWWPIRYETPKPTPKVASSF